MVAPIFFILLMGVIEFGFAFNATLGVNFASRDAALLAAEAGRAGGADCVILKSVEDAVSAPANDAQIQQVLIFRSNRTGNPVGSAQTSYSRSGSMTCNYPDGSSLTVPYTASANGYPESSRCNELGGCGGGVTTIDTIGVRVTYGGQWVTPLSGLLTMVGGGGFGGSGFTVVQTSTMRMEPVL